MPVFHGMLVAEDTVSVQPKAWASQCMYTGLLKA